MKHVWCFEGFLSVEKTNQFCTVQRQIDKRVVLAKAIAFVITWAVSKAWQFLRRKERMEQLYY